MRHRPCLACLAAPLFLLLALYLAIPRLSGSMKNKRSSSQEEANRQHAAIYDIPLLNPESYRQLWRESHEQSNDFWLRHAAMFLDWETPPTRALAGGFDNLSWFGDGRLSVAWNLVDRHAKLDSDRVAFLHEPDEEDLVDEGHASGHRLTYGQLQEQSNILAHWLASRQQPGDTVTLYMPMVPELVVSLVACVRVGLIHNVVFGGFSAEALRSRIDDAGSRLVITVDEARRGGKRLAMKEVVDEALRGLDGVQVLCLQLSNSGDLEAGRDFDYAEAMAEGARLLAVSHAGHDGHEGHESDEGQGDQSSKRFKGNFKSNTKDDVEAQNGSRKLLSHVYGADDPLFMLYTSGSTGKPKGLVHATGGYLLYTAMTMRWTMGVHHDLTAGKRRGGMASSVFGCTADIGWITGHSYVFYGPLLNGVTSLLLEPPPFYPDAGRLWRLAARLQLTHLYTAPTVVRSLKRALANAKLELPPLPHLRVLGSVGEPIDPEAWQWYAQAFSPSALVIDTYWQTETGGHLITPLFQVNGNERSKDGKIEPDTADKNDQDRENDKTDNIEVLIPALKAGSALRPFLGIQAAILEELTGKVLWQEATGQALPREPLTGVLAVGRPWPGLARSVWGDHARYLQTYLTAYPGFYFTGDRATLDPTGCYWIGGRVDDVINVNAHRLSTAEIEAALCRHAYCSEAAVLGAPDAITGQAVIAFCTRKEGVALEADRELINELKQLVRKIIGPLAMPKRVILCDDLPRTRSGKIMRRLLRKLVEGETELGDLSTLSNPHCMESLRTLWQQQ